MSNKKAASQQKRNKKLAWILSGAVIGMFGFGFLMVPLYNVLCKSLGINGKIAGYTPSSKSIDPSRNITVQFVTIRNEELPWKFYPLTEHVTVHPGENKQVTFYARNDQGHTMTIQAIPSITPGIAAKYFKKTQCFCFTKQTFPAHFGRNMPLQFHVTKDLPSNIHTITLAYTLFDLGKHKARKRHV